MRDLLNIIQILSEGVVGLSPGEILKYNWRWDKFIEHIQQKKPFTTIDGDEVVLKPSEADRFLKLRKKNLFKGALYAESMTGDPIPLSQLAKTGDFGGSAPRAGEKPEQGGKEALLVKPTQIGITDMDINAADFHNTIKRNKVLSETEYGKVIQNLADYIIAGEYVMLPEEYRGKEKEKIRKAIVDYAGEYLGVLALLYNRSRFPRKQQFLEWLGGDVGELTLNFPSEIANPLADSKGTITNKRTNRTLNISSKGTGGGAAPAISGLTIPDSILTNKKYKNVVTIVNICKTPPVLMSVFKFIDFLYEVNPKAIDEKYHKFLPFLVKEPELPLLCKQSIASKKQLKPIKLPAKYNSLFKNVNGAGTDGGRLIYGIREEIQTAINKRDAIPEFRDGVLEILEMNFIQQYCDYKGGELVFSTQWPAKLEGKIALDNKASTNDPTSNGFSFKLSRTEEGGDEPNQGIAEPDSGATIDEPEIAQDVAEPSKVTKLSQRVKAGGDVGRSKQSVVKKR